MSDFPSDIPIDERLLSMNENLYFEFLDQNQKEYKSTSGHASNFAAARKTGFDEDLQQASFVIFDQIQDSYVQPKSTEVDVPEIVMPTKDIPSVRNHSSWMPFAILAVILVTFIFMVYMSQGSIPEKMVL
jgi:hypothetical protein